MVNKINVGGLLINTMTKAELLSQISERTIQHKTTFLTTVYSEFLYNSLKDDSIENMLNRADFAVPDGIGVLWADYFLSKIFLFNNKFLRLLEVWWQVVYTGLDILLRPVKLYQTFPEKIVGADFIWDLARLATEKNFSVYLLGGYGDTTSIVVAKLQHQFPALNIVGYSNQFLNNSDQEFDRLKELQPDFLLVAYGPIKQERWIVQHLQTLPTKFVVGLGGTFDYVAGVRKAPPKIIRQVGLEWLYRLFTQPHRIDRIYHAVVSLIYMLVQYKLQKKND